MEPPTRSGSAGSSGGDVWTTRIADGGQGGFTEAGPRAGLSTGGGDWRGTYVQKRLVEVVGAEGVFTRRLQQRPLGAPNQRLTGEEA